jgi:cephalosporin-C deacetylase-like acetyl esterase
LGAKFSPEASKDAAKLLAAMPDAKERQRRQVQEMVDFTQHAIIRMERHRNNAFWATALKSDAEKWKSERSSHKEKFWEDLIGRLPAPQKAMNAKSRQVYDEAKWLGYEVTLEVWPGVFAWGILCVPKDLKADEKRPVVVCQHGLEGVPADTIEGPQNSGYQYYKAFAAKLAERGFVTFAPHNPYRGRDQFRVLQRKANPLGKSLFSVIIAQHEQILNWLETLPFVDAQRIGFYGLSYGGKTAMRVPAVLDRYALSICSADFNEWVTKNVTVHSPYSYMYTIEYEMPEFALGRMWNYAEMAALIAPRPFMVERGHDDGVAPDEWVAYEFAKVQRFYDKLGIGDRTEIEFFDGPHSINGLGTFKFLHRHLNWPEP